MADATEKTDSVGKIDGASLLKFALNECKDFYGYLTKAVESAIEKGEEPVSVFSKKRLPTTVSKAEKVKRKPSAFNIFMQKKCEQMRAAGASGQSSAENNTLFGQAAAAWKELSDDQRKSYMLLYAENSEDPALDNLPVPQSKSSVKAEATPDKRKRKKDVPEKATPAKAPAAAAAADADGKKKKKKKKSAGEA